jgi:hypothetical protein
MHEILVGNLTGRNELGGVDVGWNMTYLGVRILIGFW